MDDTRAAIAPDSLGLRRHAVWPQRDPIEACAMSEPLPSFKRVGPPTRSGSSEFGAPEAPPRAGERKDHTAAAATLDEPRYARPHRADDTPVAAAAEEFPDEISVSAGGDRSARGARARSLWRMRLLLGTALLFGVGFVFGAGFVAGGGIAAMDHLHRPSSGERQLLSSPNGVVSPVIADWDEAPPANVDGAPPGPIEPDLSPILAQMDAVRQQLAGLERHLQAQSERLDRLERQANETLRPAEPQEPSPSAGPPSPETDQQPGIDPVPGPATAPVAASAAVASLARVLPKLVLSTSRGLRPVYRVNETMSLQVQPTADAFVYCYYQDADGMVARIFPNRFQPDAFIPARRLVEIPPGSEKPFNIRFDKAGSRESVACLASDLELGVKLPDELKAQDLEPMPVRTVDDVTALFQSIAPSRVDDAWMLIEVTQ